MSDEPEVTPPAEEPEIETEPETEPEEADPEPEPEPEPEEDVEQLRKDAKAFKDQKKRAEKAEADAKALRDKYEPKDKQPAAAAAPGDDNAVRARLEARGVLDEDAQNEVLEAARMLGISPLEALARPLVKARLEEIKADKAAKNATPPPRSSGGKTPSTTNIGVLADKVEKGGDLPTDPALAEKVQQELARRAQHRS